MFDDKVDSEHLKTIFEKTQVLRKPISGIISGYHTLPYILAGPVALGSERAIENPGKDSGFSPACFFTQCIPADLRRGL